jgi:hypothetical protein
LAVGDFDADGKPDLVIHNYNSLSVLLGNGDGTFQAAKNISGDGFASVTVGDINADGKLDLVAALYPSGATSYVKVLLGYGDGTFADVGNTTLPSTLARAFDLGDFNGDGWIDVATANQDTVDASVLLNAGDWVLPPPTLSINDVTLTEGNTGTVNAVFTVNLSAVWNQTVTVHYSTANNTATTAGNDYQSKSGTLTFAPGVTSQTISVLVNGDRVGESDEGFFVNLDSPTVATIADGQGVGTILDDEPDITITDMSGTEGNTGATNFVFTVSLSASYDQTVTVHYSTANGTATAGSDYTTTSGTVTFLAGETSHTVTVFVTGDRVAESDETFFVNLDNASSNASIADAQGVGTILDDEPRITINDVSLSEGNSGTKSFNFTVSLSATYDASVTVSYATANGTATVANNDYKAKSGTVTFAAGVTSQTVTILVNGDRRKEPDETFYVNLSNAVSGLITDSQGVGTILNDDPGGNDQAPTAGAPNSGNTTDAAALRAVTSLPTAGNPSAPAASGHSRQLPAALVDRVFATIPSEKREAISYHATPRRVEAPPLKSIIEDDLVWT